MADFRMAVLGDSVNWGQGLKEPKKFHSRVKKALSATDSPESSIMLAHSGAIIGAGVATTHAQIDGEVPTSYPTILQQCEFFSDSPETVSLVLVNGGINDIDVRTILNPFTDSSDLQDMILQYCYADMKVLLGEIVNKFTNPAARIVVTSYYPILSDQSHFPLVDLFLAIHGLSIVAFAHIAGINVWGKIVKNCDQFSTQSTMMFQQAIDEINRAAGGPARILFANPPFTASNASLAPDAWLWGVNGDFSAEDPLRDDRRAACNMFEPDLIQRQSCYRASAGHPNNKGARQFAEAILALLR